MTSRYRPRIGLSLAVLALAMTAAVTLALSPSWQYQLTGHQRPFNRAVSRAVPRGSTLARLESVAGPGKRASVPSWLQQIIRSRPNDYPDGWREEDFCVSYSFPGHSTWYFQVRDGRLVNYDPAVLAGQPQEQIAVIK